jgi:hypothetical protein
MMMIMNKASLPGFHPVEGVEEASHPASPPPPPPPPPQKKREKKKREGRERERGRREREREGGGGEYMYIFFGGAIQVISNPLVKTFFKSAR